MIGGDRITSLLKIEYKKERRRYHSIISKIDVSIIIKLENEEANKNDIRRV